MKRGAVVLVLLLVLGSANWVHAGQSDYIIGPQDVLAITVFDHADLTGQYEVELDGTLTFPLIGQVEAAGLTLRDVEAAIVSRLADGYLRHPQVDVVVSQYRSQQIFVIGEVRSPGSYAFTGQMTLIEALAKAGSSTSTAGNEVLIVRAGGGATDAGAVSEAGESSDEPARSEVLTVDLDRLRRGVLEENVTLQPGDTVVVQRAETVYVFGQVNSPGAYPIAPGTTVLQALALAGGMTDRGADGRIDVLRDVDGRQEKIRVDLDDVVQAGDTVVVPQRYF